MIFILSLLLTALIPASAVAKEFVLATTEWPPYTCDSCEGQGASISVLKKLFKAEGHELRVIFYPWSRCVQEARKGRVHGVWPSWPADLVGTGLISSEVIFHSPLGIAERKDHPQKVTSFKDLKNVRLGVVRDYGYSLEYLELVQKGLLKPEEVRVDIHNIEKPIGQHPYYGQELNSVIKRILKINKNLEKEVKKEAARIISTLSPD